ncbi:hypothetical protein MA16_Dca005041 [Dendrobium catenatum]|uniref:Uncharacterized protein n=1 Tax=Dendrobium catenatum TaxID=906689 RepID=A0A2I0WGQ7_9ASPA|nr:hypothetical protein MA16_Dca005041 [Dendrobium catenatum]
MRAVGKKMAFLVVRQFIATIQCMLMATKDCSADLRDLAEEVRERKKDGYLRNEQAPVVVVISHRTEEQRGGVISDQTGRNVADGGEEVIYSLVQNSTSHAKEAKSQSNERWRRGEGKMANMRLHFDVGCVAGEALLVPSISPVVTAVQVDEAHSECSIPPVLGVGIYGLNVDFSEDCGGVNNVVSTVGSDGIVGNELRVSANSFIYVPMNLIDTQALVYHVGDNSGLNVRTHLDWLRSTDVESDSDSSDYCDCSNPGQDFRLVRDRPIASRGRFRGRGRRGR